MVITLKIWKSQKFNENIRKFTENARKIHEKILGKFAKKLIHDSYLVDMNWQAGAEVLVNMSQRTLEIIKKTGKSNQASWWVLIYNSIYNEKILQINF